MYINNTDFASVDDDEALRSKVNEAMSVYDEYMKGRGPPDTNGAGQEDGPSDERTEGVQA